MVASISGGSFQLTVQALWPSRQPRGRGARSSMAARSATPSAQGADGSRAAACR